MLFTYVCIDNYLKHNGRLGFIITQTLFKSKGAGDGFRRFRLGNREHFRVLQVDDLTEFQPFEGATNCTAVVTFQKGKRTTYPAEYAFWRRKKTKSRINFDGDLDEVLEGIETKKWKAEPIEKEQPTSPWISARPQALSAMHRATGASVYRAYAGSCTWANGIFWLNIDAMNDAGEIIASNLHDVGRLENIQPVEAALEPDLLFPLLRGRNIERWRANSSGFLLNVQNAVKRRGLDEDLLKSEFPLTYGYLSKFEDILRRRSGFRKYFCKEVGKGAKKRLVPFAPFYSLYNIGEYTLAPFKICWREQAEFFTCAVVHEAKVAGSEKVIIPDHKLMFVPLQSADEAHYVCAMLNSSIATLIVKSYGVETQTSTHVLKHVRLPQFDRKNRVHQQLSELSERAHDVAGREDESSRQELKSTESKIDELAARVWGISETELADIQFSLADLR